MSEFVQEQQPEPRVLPPRMTERVQALTELRRDETTTEEPRVPTTFVERLQQFMRQENIGVRALAKRLGKSHGNTPSGVVMGSDGHRRGHHKRPCSWRWLFAP